MKVFHSLERAPIAGSAIALGNFDGVHLGHQALLSRARELGHPAVLTFDPHPIHVLHPGRGPTLLTSTARRLELFESLGVELAGVQPFTRAFAGTPAREFERLLLEEGRPAHVLVGPDFAYGAHRQGTLEALGEAASACGIQLHVIEPVSVEGAMVSSTRIRDALREGRVAEAARLLGRPFDLDGKVIQGAQRGRTLGFPTANLEVLTPLVPATGIYAVRARLADGRWLAGAASIGHNPTFGEGALSVEVYLIDFEGDLYGQPMRVAFLERLRPEQRFDSVQALIAQMEQDVARARAIAAGSPR